jgi:DNA modification methylase
VVTLLSGDCLDVMATLPENSVDTLVTDPPYGTAFMAKAWDVTGVAFRPETWAAALRVAKPGAILMAFGGTRTFHRLACAIEDAGWEIRDTMMWVYGSGFPKSHDISKGIDRAAGAERERVPGGIGKKSGETYSKNGGYVAGEAISDAPATPVAVLWDGWGTALKPAWEPIILAMKPLDGTFAQNAQKWGVAGLWIDGGKVGTDILPGQARGNARVTSFASGGITPERAGRWPSNLVHDGSDEVLAGFPNEAARYFYCAKASRAEREAGCEGTGGQPCQRLTMYSEKDGVRIPRGNPITNNYHPTVKPLALMRYLCRLTKTPTGGVVLDPFMGSGSTGCAAIMEGREFIGIEKEADYLAIAERRIRDAGKQPRLL